MPAPGAAAAESTTKEKGAQKNEDEERERECVEVRFVFACEWSVLSIHLGFFLPACLPILFPNRPLNTGSGDDEEDSVCVFVLNERRFSGRKGITRCSK